MARGGAKCKEIISDDQNGLLYFYQNIVLRSLMKAAGVWPLSVCHLQVYTHAPTPNPSENLQ
jgi:hypothetical protein